MGRLAVSLNEQPRKPKTIGSGPRRDLGKAEILAHPNLKQLASAHSRRGRPPLGSPHPGLDPSGQLYHQPVERFITSQPALGAMGRQESTGHGAGKPFVVDQSVAETQRRRRILAQRDQLVRKPSHRQVEHGVVEPILGRAMAIMDLTRLNQNAMPRHACVEGAPAREPLDSLPGHTDKQLIVAVRIIGMSQETSLERLNPSFPAPPKIDGTLACA